MITIIAPGPLATVQDLGRPAARRYGVPTSGAMDPFALQAANELVGNAPGVAAIEFTAGGVELEFTRPTLFALAGADLGATLGERPLPLWTSRLASAGARLRLHGRRTDWGARAYLAVAGGIAIPHVLGSAATDLAGGFGGYQGRPLRAGDMLAAGAPPRGIVSALGRTWPTSARPAYRARPVLRLITGPHRHCFAPDAVTHLAGAELRISATSNRMGYRLEGATVPYLRPISLPSLGVVPGTLQVPPDGAPILLMADAQTTGGYPVLGVVIGADLPLAAQLLPGDTLTLTPTTLAAAHAARRAQTAALAAGPELAPDDGEYLALWAGAWPDP
jgi:biotin-dependent carboxylase-like uncharacterized protein